MSNTIPTIPPDSIHPPRSSNPDPAGRLRELGVSNTKQQIEEILRELGVDMEPLPHPKHASRIVITGKDEAIEAIDRLVTEACLQEFKTMWNKTQPDIVPEGWEPDTEEGEYIKDRIAELQSQLNKEEK